MNHRFLCLLLLTLVTVPLIAQDPPPADLQEWMTQRRLELVEAAVDQANTASKQTEAPAAAGGGTSLVDQSSAADFVSAALNFAGMSTSDDAAEPKTVTATAYAFVSAVRGFDPLDPHYYNLYRPWRRWSATIGYDAASEEETEGEPAADKTRLYSVKYTTNDRNPRFVPTEFKKLTDSVTRLAFAQTEAEQRIRAYAARQPHIVSAYLTQNRMVVNAQEIEKFTSLVFTSRGDLVKTTDTLTDMYRDFTDFFFIPGGNIMVFDSLLTAADREAINAILREGLPAFAGVEADARAVIEAVQKKPQFAVTATYKQPESEEGTDSFEAGLIFDKALSGGTTFNANAAYAWVEEGTNADSESSLRFAAQLRWRLSAVTSMRSSLFDIAAEGNLKSGSDDVYKAQAKLTVPLAAGISMPVSVTYANREELIEEEDVRGHIGFTFDFSRVLAAFRLPGR